VTTAEEATLEARLAAAATDPARIPEFVEALLESTVIVAGVVDPPSDDGRQSATLAPLVNGNGESVQPFFTSEDRLNETLAAIPGYQSQWIALPCRVLWEMTRGTALLLNPNSDYGKEFLPGEIAQILDGKAVMTPTVIEKETPVLIGQPAVVPPGMVDALVGLFARYTEVDSAFLGWKATPETRDESYLVVIVGPPNTRATVSAELGTTLVTYSLVHPIDVMFAEPGASHLLSEIDPFYSKNTEGKKRRWPFGRK